MTSLLDANLLIALFDEAHVHHQAAHQWLSANRSQGWATCPLTENACVRIIAQPSYPGRLSIAEISRRLHQATSSSDHHFWADDIRLSDPSRFDHSQIVSPKQLTDIYLLALAVEHAGRLTTFDKGIPLRAVPSASALSLCVL